MGRPLAFLCLLACMCVAAHASIAPVADVDANFQVALYYSFDGVEFVHRCTGAVVSDIWVVTSASCLCSGNRSTCNDDLARWQIRFGATFLNNVNSLGVSRIEIHPLWSGIFSRGFDVALFRLTGSVNTFRPDMRPVLLPDTVEFSCENRPAAVWSWGTAGSGFLNQLVVTPAQLGADWLIVATNLIINNIREEIDQVIALAECTLSPNCIPHGISVQYNDARMGFCPTDIGAPLIYTTPTNQRVLLGVGSYRFAGNGIFVNPNQPCVDLYVNGSTRAPVVFQEIDVATAWIRATTTNVTIFGSICGDGLIGFNEECDDGNLLNADGCSSQCRLESNWVCTPGRAEWMNRRNRDDDDSHPNWILNLLPTTRVDFCRPSICHVMHDDDDDGSSSSAVAIAVGVAVPVGLALLVCCIVIIVLCCRRRRKPEPVPVEPVVAVAPVAPMITTPASPLMEAPPSTPAVELSPVHMEIVSPAYGMGTNEVMPPIIQREDIMQAPVIETTTEYAPTTWIKE